MEKQKKLEKIFKWIVFSIIIANILVYFLPIYQEIYMFGSQKQTSKYYLYEGRYSVSYISIISILALALIAVFMFAEIKNKEYFALAFGSAYFLPDLFTLLTIRKAVKDTDSSYKYSYCYGYYLFWIVSLLLILSVICWFVIKLLLKRKQANQETKETEELNEELTELDIVKRRLDTLNELKEEGVLTEEEYNQKRANIINDLKV